MSSFRTALENNDHELAKSILDNGYIPNHAEYYSYIYSHDVEGSLKLLHVLAFHPTTRIKYFKFIINFALFHILSPFMDAVETNENDQEFHDFIYQAIDYRDEGRRQFILGNRDRGIQVEHEDYPIELITARILKSERVNLANAPDNIVNIVLGDDYLENFRVYVKAGFNFGKYGGRTLINTRSIEIFEARIPYVDVNVVDKKGETVLIKYCKEYSHNNNERITLLVKHGANVKILDNEGHDCIYYLEKQLGKYYGDYSYRIKNTIDLLKGAC